MHRSRTPGFIACILSVLATAAFVYYAFIALSPDEISSLAALNDRTFYAIATPIALVAFAICGTGFWVGWTILTIKVAPPMPDIVEKKDYAKLKAFFLCLLTLALAVIFIYGVYQRSYWALAVPAAAITLIVLGMVFWIGIAIITARSTLPENKKK